MPGFTIHTITPQVAAELCSGPRFDLQAFVEKGDANDVLLFAHYAFFYSYPAWGKKWPNGKDCVYHRVETQCHLCGYKPERNYAGVGTLYLLNNGVSEPTIRVKNGPMVKRRGQWMTPTAVVPNTPRLSRMILLCGDCAKQYFTYQQQPAAPAKAVQLSLF